MNLYIHVQHTVSIVFYSEETLSERQFFQGVEILGEVHHRLYWFVYGYFKNCYGIYNTATFS